eukprot:1156227-Pelagomonas_calceolata.AAC.8
MVQLLKSPLGSTAHCPMQHPNLAILNSQPMPLIRLLQHNAVLGSLPASAASRKNTSQGLKQTKTATNPTPSERDSRLLERHPRPAHHVLARAAWR